MFHATTAGRRWATAAAAVVIALALASAARADLPPRADREAIQDLLERRAEAVREHDRAAFLATLANHSRAFVERQRRLFTVMGTLPLADYELRARWDRSGDLARASDSARYGDVDRVVIPITEERYRLEAFDVEAAAEDLFYTFVKDRGRWLIAEDTDLDDLGLWSARHLWDGGPLQTERSEHFLKLQHPCEPRSSDCTTLPDDFMSLAEDALERVQKYWDGPWHTQMVLLVPSTSEELARIIQSTLDLDNFVAFAYSTVDVDRDFDYTGHRILLNPDAFDNSSGEQAFTILAHELLHVATRDSSGPFVPLAVEEGYAEYAGYDADPGALSFLDSTVEAGNFDRELPQDYEFTIGEGESIYLSYQEAQSAVRFFVERWGLGRFQAFYRRLGSVDVDAGVTAYHVDRALRDTIGVGLDDFEREWASSIEKR